MILDQILSCDINLEPEYQRGMLFMADIMIHICSIPEKMSFGLKQSK